ncbi:MAG: formate--tetrahydrofolate ligase, partial [Candidatus Saelkia tenebricola]|nr:formate--tetrahydrofolate ligase [Candidatus Saelkia tenebricola]
LLKDALKPNLVQTVEGNPVLVHTGPFANIAHGNSSLIATKMALGLSDYVITEGGFGADLGFEKFIHIVARKAGFKIATVVVVVSVRALKCHGEYSGESGIKALKKGCANLAHHVGIVRKFGLEPIVCINKFSKDSTKEIEFLKKYCQDVIDVTEAVSEVYQKGAQGGTELAEKVLEKDDSNSKRRFLYPLKSGIKDKIDVIAKQVYGANGVDYSKGAEEKIKFLESFGFSDLPVNIAKTQFSLTHNPALKGVPEDWRLSVKDIFVSNGAGFLVVLTAKMLLLPGLPRRPVLEKVKLKNGKFEGLF